MGQNRDVGTASIRRMSVRLVPAAVLLTGALGYAVGVGRFGVTFNATPFIFGVVILCAGGFERRDQFFAPVGHEPIVAAAGSRRSPR